LHKSLKKKSSGIWGIERDFRDKIKLFIFNL